jgi:hypothetical protein
MTRETLLGLADRVRAMPLSEARAGRASPRTTLRCSGHSATIAIAVPA